MTHDQLMEPLVRALWQPRCFLVPAAFVALVFVCSILSLRILSRHPDFPRKHELEAGARWAGPFVLLVVILAIVVAYLVMTRTAYMVSSTLLGNLVLDLGLAFPAAILPNVFLGPYVAVQAAGRRLGKRTFDIAAWIAEIEQRRHRHRGLRGMALAALVFLIGMDVYVILGFTYPFDHEFDTVVRGQRIADAAAQSVQRRMQAMGVEHVRGYVSNAAIHALNDLDIGTWSAVAGSAAHISSAVRGRHPDDESVTGRYTLFVEVGAGDFEKRARTILDAVHRLLAEKHEPHHWRITVYKRDSHISISGTYEPNTRRRSP